MANNFIDVQETATVITPEALLQHWQGHRKLTRRVIEAFPEQEFFQFSIGGMRPFSLLIKELMDIAGPGIKGLATGKWKSFSEADHQPGASTPQTKKEMLQMWDEVTNEINLYWPQLPLHRFQEEVLAFNQYKGTVWSSIFYFIDNEIHHRGQGYVYLRALGIEPPPFWER